MKFRNSLIILSFLLAAQTAIAYDFEENGIYFNILPSEEPCVEVTTGSSDYNYECPYAGDIIIPSEVTHKEVTYKVSRIGERAFLLGLEIFSVQLPETIETIGTEAFWSCTELKEIWLPSSLIIIDDGAFGGCPELQGIEIPDNVEKLGWGAFMLCHNLSFATLGSGIQEIPGCLFSDCSNLQEVRLGENIERIGNSAFSYCSRLENINFPEKLKAVENNAFYCCESLYELNLSHTDLREVEEAAFQECINLWNVLLPSCIEQFSPFSFLNCNNLSYIEISESEAHDNQFHTMDGCVYDRDMSTLLFVPANQSLFIPDFISKLGDYCYMGNKYAYYIDIPQNISELGKGVFLNCQGLHQAYFPSSITEIPESTFQGCYCLDYVSFPEKLEKIGDYAFRECDALTDLWLPGSLSSIGREAFAYCWTLNSVGLGENIKEIGERAFYECENLNTFSCQSPLPTTEGYEIFSNYYLSEKGNLFVPSEYDEDYRFSPVWENFRYINNFHTNMDGLADEELATLSEVSDKLWERGRGLEFYQAGPDNVWCSYGMVAEGGYITQIDLPEYFWDMEFPVELLQFKQLRKLNLYNNNLRGTLDHAVEFLKENPGCGRELNEINLTYNNLSGNIGPFGNAFPSLLWLDLSHNRFTDVYPMVPSHVSLTYNNQETDFISEISVSDILNGKFEGKFPSIMAYDHWSQNFNKSFIMRINGQKDFYVEMFRTYNGEVGINRISSQNVFYGKKDDPLLCYSYSDYSYYYYEPDISFQLLLNFDEGDADFSGSFNIADIQAIINYIFGDTGVMFNFTAADTYPDEIVNVQDVVVAINMLLSKSLPDIRQGAQLETRSFATNVGPYIYISKGEVILSSEIPLNALHIMHTGSINWDLEALGLTQTEENGNVVAYSMTGSAIPAGETVIGHVLGNGSLLYAGAADNDANYLSIDISDADTAGISAVETHSAESLIYNLQGIPMAKDQLIPGNTYIKNGRKFIAK